MGMKRVISDKRRAELRAAASEVSKLTVVRRLKAEGLAEAARQALDAAPETKMEWDAAQTLARDDATVRGFLKALGASDTTIDAILAPE